MDDRGHRPARIDLQDEIVLLIEVPRNAFRGPIATPISQSGKPLCFFAAEVFHRQRAWPVSMPPTRIVESRMVSSKEIANTATIIIHQTMVNLRILLILAISRSRSFADHVGFGRLNVFFPALALARALVAWGTGLAIAS